MNIIDVARAMGVDVTSNEVTGAIDEVNVLGALADLIERDPENQDLYDEAAARVRQSRSAGVEEIPSGSVLTRPSKVAVVTTQLRYRSEMADIFTDLAIDVGLRDQRKLVPA